jgi:hypothetical protein
VKLSLHANVDGDVSKDSSGMARGRVCGRRRVVGGVVVGGDLGGARATRGVVKCAGNA